jgi:hypothetical protein
LTKIAQLRLRFVCLFDLSLNKEGPERQQPILALVDHAANAR